MKPREWFGLIVRTFGLVVFFIGLYYVTSALFVAATPSLLHKATPTAYAVYGLALVGLSLYFLRGAPALLRFSYPEETLSDQNIRSD